MDAINVVFNVFVGSVLVIGAFGLVHDVELPESQAKGEAGFSKKFSYPRPAADEAPDVCQLPECATTVPSFVETKDLVVVPAPKPAAARAGPTLAKPTVDPVPATLKHGDDHPSTNSKRGRDKDGRDRDKDRDEDRDRERDSERKSFEKQREQTRKALERQRDKDDDEHDEDEKDEDDDEDDEDD